MTSDPMKRPFIQELDRAIERGWANGGHLAAIRELATEASNDPVQDACSPVTDAMVDRAVDAWEQFWNGYHGPVTPERHRAAARHVLEQALGVRL